MGVTLTKGYQKKDVRMAELAKAIGHPARLAILRVLLKNPGCICGDIVEELPLSQPTVSQHLRALKDAGLIIGTVEGVSVCYCLNTKVWKEAKMLFESLLDQLPSDCC